MAQRFFIFIVGLATLGLLPIFIATFAAKSFLYQPTHTSRARLAAIGSTGGWRIDTVEVADGVRLRGLVRPPRTASARWFLFFGGNAASLEQNREILARIPTSTAVDVGLAVYAYRGYDGSEGAPGEAALTHDAAVLVAHLAREHAAPPGALTLVGQSLGSGVAARVAAELSRAGTPAAGLALVSPYTSIARVVDDHLAPVPLGWALRDRWSTEDVLPDVKSPIVLVHGTDDTLISVDHARRLKALAGSGAELLELPGRGHHDVWDDPRALAAVRSVAERVLDASR